MIRSLFKDRHSFRCHHKISSELKFFLCHHTFSRLLRVNWTAITARFLVVCCSINSSSAPPTLLERWRSSNHNRLLENFVSLTLGLDWARSEVQSRPVATLVAGLTPAPGSQPDSGLFSRRSVFHKLGVKYPLGVMCNSLGVMWNQNYNVVLYQGSPTWCPRAPGRPQGPSRSPRGTSYVVFC